MIKSSVPRSLIPVCCSEHLNLSDLLAGSGARAHARQMFAVDEATAEAIRRALHEVVSYPPSRSCAGTFPS